MTLLQAHQPFAKPFLKALEQAERENGKVMEANGIYPSITASISGKQRRLTLSRQWRRAIEKGDLDRSTPVHYEPGPGVGSMIEAQGCPELAALFDELKGPLPERDTVFEQPATPIAEAQIDRLVNVKTEITAIPAKKPIRRSSAPQNKPKPVPADRTIATTPSADVEIERSALGWAMQPLRRYAVFKGRSRRKEFWSFQLFVMVPLAVLFGIAGAAGNQMMVGLIGISFLAGIIPTLALTVRRLHDRGLSGWLVLCFAFASIIPIVGFLFSLAFYVLLALPGTTGPNLHGPDPKG